MFVRLSKLRGDGRVNNIADRLCFRWNPLVLISITAVLLLHWMLGTPIACWTPAHFTTVQTRYAESECWVARRVWQKYDSVLPDIKRTKADPVMQTRAHLWVPFVLLFMAMVSVLPNWLWSIFIAASDVKLDNLSRLFRSPKLTDNDRKAINRHENGIEEKNRVLQNLYSWVTSAVFPRHDVLLVLAYTVVKILNVACVHYQAGVLDGFSSPEKPDRLTTSYINTFLYAHSNTGNNPTGNATSLTQFPPSLQFPDVILCDFAIRGFVKTSRYTIQCVLSVNHYSRVIIAFVSTWLLFLHAATVIDLITWLVRLVTAIFGTVVWALFGKDTAEIAAQNDPSIDEDTGL